MIALGLDPGFASCGFGVLDVSDRHGLSLLELGVMRTAKAKAKVLQREDDHRRAAELSRGLLRLIETHRPGVICAEALSLVQPKGGRMPVATNAKMGRVWGLVDMLCEAHGLALLQVSPQTLKDRLCGRRNASKAEVQQALDEVLEGQLSAHLARIRASRQHEHAVDAVGAVVASLDEPHFRLARAAAERGAA